MIPDDIVERVLAEADSVSIIGEFVKLKRSGSSFRGPCPFHSGKDANFSVMPGGGYYCFVCHEKGSVFTFLQKRLGLEFVDAVKFVGDRVGIKVEDEKHRSEGIDPREPAWELHTTVAEYFREQLWRSPLGRVGREYLASRSVPREHADRFGLGYSPRDSSAMRLYLNGLGFDDDRQVAAGLLMQSDDRPGLRPRFRNRLMFPILDARGQVLGFGGRTLDDGKPKYLNSAESDIFSKRHILYGLNWARSAIRRTERVFIVEGYFDVIRLMMAGIEEVVAPLGTALTEAQASLVQAQKAAKSIYLLYDSDHAGLKATFRSGDALLAHGLSVRVVTLPGGEDPDTFVATAGKDGFELAVGSSVDILDRKIQILSRGGYFSDLLKKREALDKLLPTIRITTDRVTRELYIARTSEVAGVSTDALRRELTAVAGDGPQPRLSPQVGQSDEVERRLRRQTGVRGGQAERDLVRSMLHQRRFVESVGERLSGELIDDPAYRQIFFALVRGSAEMTPEEIALKLDEDAIEILQALLEETGGLDRADELVVGSMNMILGRALHDRKREIDRALPLANSAEKDHLIREKERLVEELKGLGRPRWKMFIAPR